MNKIFDENNCSLIGYLINIKEYCNLFEKRIIGDGFHQTNINNYVFIHYKNFYAAVKNVCDPLIFFIINEEISNQTGRRLLPDLMNQVFGGDYFDPRLMSEKGFDPLNRMARNDREIKNLVVMQYNETLGSLMLDFSVSIFSAFEFWVDKLYNKICPDHASKILEGRVEKIIDRIKKYSKNPSDELLERSVDEISNIPGKFVSLPDKIAGLTKSMGKGMYKRKLKKDVDIINYMAAQRNTVHNLGVHRKSQKTINIKGVDYFLNHGEVAKFESWKHLFDLVVELVKIYTALISSMPNTVNHVPGFIQEEVAAESIEFLTNIINDFLYKENHHERLSSNDEIFCNILVNKLNFSSQQASRFVSFLLKSEKLEFNPHDTLEFLAIPNLK